jgi:hypothetical protein
MDRAAMNRAARFAAWLLVCLAVSAALVVGTALTTQAYAYPLTAPAHAASWQPTFHLGSGRRSARDLISGRP